MKVLLKSILVYCTSTFLISSQMMKIFFGWWSSGHGKRRIDWMLWGQILNQYYSNDRNQGWHSLSHLDTMISGHFFIAIFSYSEFFGSRCGTHNSIYSCSIWSWYILGVAQKCPFEIKHGFRHPDHLRSMGPKQLLLLLLNPK